jgi:hypothetical protein
MLNSVVASDGDASSGGSGMLMIGDGSVTFGITLPLEASGMAVSELTVLVGPDPGMVLSDQRGFGGFWPAGYIAEIRDPATGEWRELGDINVDATCASRGPRPARTSARRPSS